MSWARAFRKTAAAASIGAAGCGTPNSEAGKALTFPAAVRVSVEGTRKEGPGATLGEVVAARLTAGGRHVVVLDFVAPYVKVFDGQGHFERSFLRGGDGPGETRLATVLATSGDTAILIGDAAGRLMVFGMDGLLRHETREPRLRPLSATEGCGGDWIVYGPRRGRGDSAFTWLHRVRFRDGGGLDEQNSLRDSLASEVLPMGVAYGLVRDGERALAWHDLATERLLAAWACGDSTLHLTHRGPVRAPSREAEVRRGGSVLKTIRPGTRARGGLAALPAGVVVAEVVLGSPGSGVTELTLLRDDGSIARTTVPGRFTLRDSRRGVGVLMSASDPDASVFLVPERHLLSLFRR